MHTLHSYTSSFVHIRVNPLSFHQFSLTSTSSSSQKATHGTANENSAPIPDHATDHSTLTTAIATANFTTITTAFRTTIRSTYRTTDCSTKCELCSCRTSSLTCCRYVFVWILMLCFSILLVTFLLLCDAFLCSIFGCRYGCDHFSVCGGSSSSCIDDHCRHCTKPWRRRSVFAYQLGDTGERNFTLTLHLQ